MTINTGHAQTDSGKTFWKALSQRGDDSANFLFQKFLYIEDWKIENKTNELELQGSFWIIEGQSPNQDTLPVELFHIFLATAINGELQNKRTIINNCHRQQHNNGFGIRIKIKDPDGLYVAFCSDKIQAVSRIDTLFFKKESQR